MLDRHLRRLAREGWQVIITVPAAALRPLPSGDSYQVRTLPSRKFWWPPASPRFPATMRLRVRLWANAVIRDPEWSAPPDVILTVLWGYAAVAAARVAVAWCRPLAVIVHDRLEEAKLPALEDRVASWIESTVLRSAARIWAVSDEMRAALAPLAPAEAIRTLPPVPDDYAPPGGWQPQYRSAPIIAHAGALHSYHVEYLAAVARAVARVGGELLIVTASDNPALAQLRASGTRFRHQPAFPTSTEALAFLSREATALTVMYPLEPSDHRRAPTGFPSRV